MSRTAWIIVAIVIVSAGAFAVWFFNNHERYTEERNLGYSGEAASNPFYAAELFLKRSGMQVNSLSSILKLTQMPSSQDVLILPTQRFDLGDDRIKQIMEWVNDGGHLIALARYAKSKDEEVNDGLFAQLGVRTQRDKYRDVRDLFERQLLGSNSDELDESESKTGDAGKSDNGVDAPRRDPASSADTLDSFETRVKPIVIRVNDRVEDKRVYFRQGQWMINEGDYEQIWSVDGANGAQLLEFSIGAGRISLLSDVNFFKNQYIGKFDHAAFLYTLVNADDYRRRLWLVRNDDGPSLWALLWTHASGAIVVFFVGLAIWVWRQLWRFGPSIANQEVTRRSLREHIVSSGYFQWRNRNRAELLESVQKAVYDQIARTRPLWSRLSADELSEKLAYLTGLDRHKVHDAITATQKEKEPDFTATIEILSVIKEKL